MNYQNAVKRVNQLKKFYKHLTWFGIIAGILFFKDHFEHGRFDFSHFNGSILLLIWGIILAIEAVKLFIFNPEWEKRIIENELKKTKTPINF